MDSEYAARARLIDPHAMLDVDREDERERDRLLRASAKDARSSSGGLSERSAPD